MVYVDLAFNGWYEVLNKEGGTVLGWVDSRYVDISPDAQYRVYPYRATVTANALNVREDAGKGFL